MATRCLRYKSASDMANRSAISLTFFCLRGISFQVYYTIPILRYNLLHHPGGCDSMALFEQQRARRSARLPSYCPDNTLHDLQYSAMGFCQLGATPIVSKRVLYPLRIISASNGNFRLSKRCSDHSASRAHILNIFSTFEDSASMV